MQQQRSLSKVNLRWLVEDAALDGDGQSINGLGGDGLGGDGEDIKKKQIIIVNGRTEVHN